MKSKYDYIPADDAELLDTIEEARDRQSQT